MSTEPSAASRLCIGCGMCCNGVMFHTVRLQPADSAKALAALGLKLKRKKKHDYILQPCPAYRDSQCSIYALRPERCRRFECRQLQRVASGELSEADAAAHIGEVLDRVKALEALLQQAGETRPKGPLSRRYERVNAEPLDPATQPAEVQLRDRITAAFTQLDEILDRDFRVQQDRLTAAN